MTKISSSTGMVALVQTSLMLPVALVSTPAGAIADMFDRRIVGLVALSIALAGSISLSALAWLGVMTPALLLVSCFIIGSGMALFGPAWQASVSEQVPAEALPAAVALNGISYNIARSFGPAIGGVIVASAGAVAAFITNALLYLPLLIVCCSGVASRSRRGCRRKDWRVPSFRAFATSSTRRPFESSLRAPWLPGLPAVGLGSRSIVARDLLHGGAQTYGVMLGTFGMGAVIGALNIYHASCTSGRRSFDPPVHDRHGRVRRCCRRKSPASAIRECARLRGSRLDSFSYALQCSCPTRRPALGRPVARWRLIRRRSRAGCAR